MELDARKIRILQAIVDDYILTAMPVGSQTIAQKQGMGLSSATIRNVMSDLEELGYLDQPHTSAGRVPSYRAYRLYVDQLMRVARLTRPEMEHIRGLFQARMAQMEDALDSTAKILSDLTNYTSVVLAPQAERVRIQRVQLVPVSETHALVVVVTDIGVVHDLIMRIPSGIGPDHLYMLSNMVTEKAAGNSPDQLGEVFRQVSLDLTGHRDLFASLLDALEEKRPPTRRTLALGGTAKLLSYPEYADTQKAAAVLSALETRDSLMRILQERTGMEFSITIGPELKSPGMREASLVTVSYRVGDGRAGSLGILGPTRMDYARVLRVLWGVRRAVAEAYGAAPEQTEEDDFNEQG